MTNKKRKVGRRKVALREGTAHEDAVAQSRVLSLTARHLTRPTLRRSQQNRVLFLPVGHLTPSTLRRHLVRAARV